MIKISNVRPLTVAEGFTKKRYPRINFGGKWLLDLGYKVGDSFVLEIVGDAMMIRKGEKEVKDV